MTMEGPREACLSRHQERLVDRDPKMDMLWWCDGERQKKSDLRLTTPLKNATARGRNGPATTLTIDTALAVVLGTRWGAGGSIVCRWCGERDRVTSEAGCGDATIKRI